jgi:hypothetical protein
MASQKPFLALHTSHSVDITINVRTESVQEAWELLSAFQVRLTEQEETMRQVKTLLREFREGLEALKADEASDDARDASNAQTIEEKNARIAELETLKAELEARPTLTDEQQAELDAMVTELGELTGNIQTDDEDQTPDTGGEDTDIPPGPVIGGLPGSSQ